MAISLQANLIAHTGALGVWFPTLRAGTGADRFTERLVEALNHRGIRAEICWLPHRAEYLPWSVQPPTPPPWVTVVHTNPRLHRRFIPAGLPCVTTLHSCAHDPALQRYKSLAQSLYHRYWTYHCEQQVLRRAQCVVAVSRYTAAKNEATLGCEPIKTIPNWVDTNTFRPNPGRTRSTPYRILYVGSMRTLKGVDLLPPIISRLGPDFELHFTGTMAELSRFGRIPDNVVALGRLKSTEQLVAAYQDADALVFPTRLEGMPLTVLEAMSCGLPVVATDCSSLPEIIDDGISGWLCPQDDIPAFVAAIRSLRDSPPDAAQIGANARGRVLRDFCEERAVSDYLAIYRQQG